MENTMNIHALRNTISGTVTVPEDPRYEATRQALLWNGRKPERFPQLIIKAANRTDVQNAVRYAAASKLPISVRGGGHHWSGVAMQGGIVLDLAALNSFTIDPDTMTAVAEPAVTNAEFARALAEHNLAFPVGHCATVPLSGYLLGGGFGWNSGQWGIACHSVEAAEVVLADGEARWVSATESPEIFWAVRGSGPEFFGVVTRYRLKLQRLPGAIRTSVRVYSIEDVKAVERWMRETMRQVPRNVEFTAVFSAAPPPLAAQNPKVITAAATVFADTEDEADDTLARIASGAPEAALVTEEKISTPFEVLYGIIGQFFPEGRRYLADTSWASQSGKVFSELATAVRNSPSPESLALAVILPPHDGSLLPDAAFSMVAPVFSCTYAVWQGDDADRANIDWLRSTSSAMATNTTGHYIGESDLDRAGRTAGSFSPGAWSRLKRLQSQYDPNGVFHRSSPADAERSMRKAV
jgi:FAD/FMN-containing dehydrogenase